MSRFATLGNHRNNDSRYQHQNKEHDSSASVTNVASSIHHEEPEIDLIVKPPFAGRFSGSRSRSSAGLRNRLAASRSIITVDEDGRSQVTDHSQMSHHNDDHRHRPLTNRTIGAWPNRFRHPETQTGSDHPRGPYGSEGYREYIGPASSVDLPFENTTTTAPLHHNILKSSTHYDYNPRLVPSKTSELSRDQLAHLLTTIQSSPWLAQHQEFLNSLIAALQNKPHPTGILTSMQQGDGGSASVEIVDLPEDLLPPVTPHPPKHQYPLPQYKSLEDPWPLPTNGVFDNLLTFEEDKTVNTIGKATPPQETQHEKIPSKEVIQIPPVVDHIFTMTPSRESSPVLPELVKQSSDHQDKPSEDETTETAESPKQPDPIVLPEGPPQVPPETVTGVQVIDRFFVPMIGHNFLDLDETSTHLKDRHVEMRVQLLDTDLPIRIYPFGKTLADQLPIFKEQAVSLKTQGRDDPIYAEGCLKIDVSNGYYYIELHRFVVDVETGDVGGDIPEVEEIANPMFLEEFPILQWKTTLL